MTRFPPFACLRPLWLAAALLLAACGGRQEPPRATGLPASQPGVSAPSPTQPGAAPRDGSALPSLPVQQTAQAGGSQLRIERLHLVNEDVRLAVRSLAEEFGLDYQIDPALRGRISTQLSWVTLDDALQSLVEPLGFQAQMDDGVLRVVPLRMRTETFALDYLSIVRAGVGTTLVQRRLGAAGGAAGGLAGGAAAGGGFGGQTGGAGAADAIQHVTVADLWEQLRVSLEGLVFAGTQVQAGLEPAVGGAAEPAPTVPTASPGVGGVGGAGGGLGAPNAYSRIGPRGRKLIINPMAGLITVSAPPEVLAEVAAYLDAVEGSVQRQVLVEAKIVEVTLNRRFSYGIDWSFLRNLGDLAVRFGQSSTGLQFTLGREGEPASAQDIDVVLEALDEQGDVRVLSAPRTAVLQNQPSVINVTQDQVFFSVTRTPVLGPTGVPISFETQVVPQQVSVGIVLNVLAQISADNVITMNVRPAITDIISISSIELEDGTSVSAPNIDRRETDAMVRVRGGETIVIGGLMQNTQTEDATGIPGLRSLPVVGPLFGRTTRESEKRELVIFITPTIVASQPPL